jgi:hypothetical protein
VVDGNGQSNYKLWAALGKTQENVRRVPEKIVTLGDNHGTVWDSRELLGS